MALVCLVTLELRRKKNNDNENNINYNIYVAYPTIVAYHDINNDDSDYNNCNDNIDINDENISNYNISNDNNISNNYYKKSQS